MDIIKNNNDTDTIFLQQILQLLMWSIVSEGEKMVGSWVLVVSTIHTKLLHNYEIC